MKKTLYSALWIVTGVILFHLLNYLGLSWNLFSWHLSFDWLTILILVGIVVSEAYIFWLIEKTKSLPAVVVSLFVCIALALFGVAVLIQLQGEVVSRGQGLGILVSRSTLSPIWYRITFPTLYFIPLILWVCHKIKQTANHRLHSIARKLAQREA